MTACHLLTAWTECRTFSTVTRFFYLLRDIFVKGLPHVGPGCVLCPRIDSLRFLAGCRRRRLNQGLVVALGFTRC